MFSRLFKKSANVAQAVDPPSQPSAHAAAAPQCAPGSEIPYHPNLIGHFTAHHLALFKVFDAIREHAVAGDFDAAQKSLQIFRRALTAHLLEENVKLYSYLSKCLAHDAADAEIMLSMKSEMGRIGSRVMRFVNEYTLAGLTRFNKVHFLAELDEIGALLRERMSREEGSLYTLYMPPEAFL